VERGQLRAMPVTEARQEIVMSDDLLTGGHPWRRTTTGARCSAGWGSACWRQRTPREASAEVAAGQEALGRCCPLVVGRRHRAVRGGSNGLTAPYNASRSCLRISSMSCSGLSVLIVATGCPTGRAHQTTPLGRVRTSQISHAGYIGRSIASCSLAQTRIEPV
jgi:hypothetical protein